MSVILEDFKYWSQHHDPYSSKECFALSRVFDTGCPEDYDKSLICIFDCPETAESARDWLISINTQDHVSFCVDSIRRF